MISQNNNQVSGGTEVDGKLFNREFIDSLKNVSDQIIKFNDGQKALELSKSLKRIFDENKNELRKHMAVYDFYKEIIIKLRFICLPNLDKDEIYNLVRNYFTWHFRLPEYNFLEKFNTKLLFTEIFEERDEIKKNIKNALLENNEVITKNGRIKTVCDWLKDYNVKLGMGMADKLKRAQYLIDFKKDKGLNDNDIEKLKILFNIYESLKYSSSTPEGFEEELPIVMNNNLYIFKQGILEPVTKLSMNLQGAEEIKTLPDKKENNINELKALLNQYPPNSLERKAIEEELDKLESKEVKK